MTVFEISCRIKEAIQWEPSDESYHKVFLLTTFPVDRKDLNSFLEGVAKKGGAYSISARAMLNAMKQSLIGGGMTNHPIDIREMEVLELERVHVTCVQDS